VTEKTETEQELREQIERLTEENAGLHSALTDAHDAVRASTEQIDALQGQELLLRRELDEYRRQVIAAQQREIEGLRAPGRPQGSGG
jgi:chromosome segregation ATPase